MSENSGRGIPKLNQSACPRCGKVGKWQKIIYGLPDENFDFEKDISGGCVISENSPSIGCKECGWSGIRNPYTGEIVDVQEEELWEK